MKDVKIHELSTMALVEVLKSISFAMPSMHE